MVNIYKNLRYQPPDIYYVKKYHNLSDYFYRKLNETFGNFFRVSVRLIGIQIEIHEYIERTFNPKI